MTEGFGRPPCDPRREHVSAPGDPGRGGAGSDPWGRTYPRFIRSSIARSTFSRAP